MALNCPYCLRENADRALVCAWCAHDVSVPDALLAERQDLIAKRDAAVAELSGIESEIAAILAARKGRR